MVSETSPIAVTADAETTAVHSVSRGRWTTGRRGAVASLKDDPFWPTRNPAQVVSNLATGRSRRPLPPGPKGLPVVGSIIPLARDPFKFFADCAQRYGDVYRVPLPMVSMVIANHPDLTSYYMEDTNLKYSMSAPIQGELAQRVIRRVGSPVQALEGPALRERRRMLMPMFGKRHLAHVSETFAESFVQSVEGWSGWAESGVEIDLQEEMHRVTLPAFLRAMFSTSISKKEIDEVDVDVRMIMRTIGSGLFMMRPPNFLPLPGRDSAPRSVTRIARLCRRLIQERRANPTDTPDLLNILLDATTADGEPLTEGDLVMELIGLIGGGYETVVASLSWTLALLLASPRDLDRLYDEIATLGGQTPTVDDLSKLTWAKACFDEGQRLQGGPLNARFAMEDDEIAGYPIRKYTIVGSSLYVVQRDPRWWGDDAHLYNPMHFFDQKLVKARPRLAFQAFGAGPHHCMGTGMAYMNAQFLLSIIFQRYRLSLRPGWTPQHQFTFSTTIKDGLPVTISRV